MSLDHQIEQHRMAVEHFAEKVKAFEESKKDFAEKVKAFEETKTDCDARILQFEEASERFRLLANKYDNVLAVARRILDEVNIERGCKGDYHDVLHDDLIDLQKALGESNGS